MKNPEQTRRSMMAGAALCLLAPAALAQNRELAASQPAPLSGRKTHRLAIQVNTNEPAAMNLALNNASNVEHYYRERGEKVEIEIVAFGPGLHMLGADASPVKDRLRTLAEKSPAISFKACSNIRENMSKAEDKTIPLVEQTTVVKSGVVRLMELQEQGWTYLRP